MINSTHFNTKIFADGADIKNMLEMHHNPLIKGFTTNPTLMRKAGITDYKRFALKLLELIKDRPISFEVFSDDFKEMFNQAVEIASWGKNVYVKIPVTNTKGESSEKLIRTLAEKGIKQNITALLTLKQVRMVTHALADSPSSYISVFAGRIADTGLDPMPMMAAALDIMQPYPQLELIWASPRELLNIIQANQIGCHIITATHDILSKMHLIGKDCTEYSLETVKMFYNDALKAGYTLTTHTYDYSEVS